MSAPDITAAIDYGRKRIGLAVSDPLGLTARGLPTVPGGPTPEAAAPRVAEVLRAERVTKILVGLPLFDSGDESEMSREARRFAHALATELGMPAPVDPDADPDPAPDSDSDSAPFDCSPGSADLALRASGYASGSGSGSPIAFIDEGYTSDAAEESLRARGIHPREARRQGLIDQEAARLLLLQHLGLPPA